MAFFRLDIATFPAILICIWLWQASNARRQHQVGSLVAKVSCSKIRRLFGAADLEKDGISIVGHALYKAMAFRGQEGKA